MAEIKSLGPFRQLRSEASVHVQRFNNGRPVQSGRGLAFWFLPDGASIAEVPMDDRDLPFIFRGRSRDFQDITVQGLVVWRVVDPVKLAARVDFSIDLKRGVTRGQPLEQLAVLLTGLAQQLAVQYLAELDVAAILAAGVKPLLASLEAGLLGSARLAEIGLEVVNVRVADVSPLAELSRALQTPTFERQQQQADQATFERRAAAVEKESAIAENELANQIELARRQKELIANEDENTRTRALSDAAAKKIAADAEAERIRVIEEAKAGGEKQRVAVYRDLPGSVLLGLAAHELASKLKSIDHLNITPDLISSLLGDALAQAGRRPAAS
jgi:regulator of protease activity HflC (stomatin/prohibitin superfamily)